MSQMTIQVTPKFVTVTQCGVRVESWDGTRAGISAVTRCCGAAVTGVAITPSNAYGLACKGCYRPVKSTYQGWEGIAAAMDEMFCPCIGDCLMHTQWVWEQTL